MANVLIIGYGNPLRTDDGLGWRAAERLVGRVNRQQVEILTCHGLTPELAEPLSKVSWSVFVDACVEPPPGELRRERIWPARPAVSASHYLSPSALLGYTRELYHRVPEAVLYSISGQSFDYGQNLSRVVERALPYLLEQVEELLARLTTREAAPPCAAERAAGADCAQPIV